MPVLHGHARGGARDARARERLVKALSEPDPHAALGDERLHEILDLCLECKACKSECPLSVDMASMKAEFLSHYQDAHGVPLRSRLFGAIRTLNRLGAATAPAPGCMPAPVGAAGHHAPPPAAPFERETLIRWDSQAAGAQARRRDLPRRLVHDLHRAGIGRAAIELLEAAGYTVRLESGGCCGRASISKGLLEDARAKAAALHERLGGDAIITGCEPSPAHAARGARQLLGRDPTRLDSRRRANGRRAREARRGAPARRRPPLRDQARAASSSTATATRRRSRARRRRSRCSPHPGREVVELDAGCCGMAGSFGFEAEHYELSMRIGECACSRPCAGSPPRR